MKILKTHLMEFVAGSQDNRRQKEIEEKLIVKGDGVSDGRVGSSNN
jgi:hypothetical protein